MAAYGPYRSILQMVEDMELGPWLPLQIPFPQSLHKPPAALRRQFSPSTKAMPLPYSGNYSGGDFHAPHLPVHQAEARSCQDHTLLCLLPAHLASCVSSLLRALPISESHSPHHCLSRCVRGTGLRQKVKKLSCAFPLPTLKKIASRN